MPPCSCSARTLQLFIQDFAGISLCHPPARLPAPTAAPYIRRYFGTKSSSRQLESTTSGQQDDGFIPFEQDAQRPNAPNVAPNRKGASQRRNKIGTPAKEHLDDEWHAEIEIAAPWPQETKSPPSAASKAIGNSKGRRINDLHAQASNLPMPDNGVGSVDQPALQDVDDPIIPLGTRANAPVSASETELAPRGTAGTSKMENRKSRKLRRLQAGTYRLQAGTRSRERLFEQDPSATLAEDIETVVVTGESGQEAGGEIDTVKRHSQESVRADGKSYELSDSVSPRLPSLKSELDRDVTASTTFQKRSGKNPQPESGAGPNRVAKSAERQPKAKDAWKIQKAALGQKFGEQGWQPRKRLSPDTLDGIRALHDSDTSAYSTETLAEHFKVTPEAIRRILRSKWRPNADEIEDRRKRWEKRGERKWKAMAEQGRRPPAKWRAKGIRTPQSAMKQAERRRHDRDVQWEGSLHVTAEPSVAERIL